MVVSANKKQQFLEKNQEKFNLLLTYLSFVRGFNLSIIEVNFQHNLELIINAITNHPNCANIQFWVLNLDDPELRFFRDEMVKRLRDFTIESDKKLVILVKGLENAIGVQSEKSPFLSDLNYIRDLLPRDIPYPIIFCLPTYAVDRLAKFAPDVWSWLSVFRFENIETPDTQQHNIIPYNLSKLEEKIPEDNQDRIDFLRERLAEYYQSQDDSVKELFYLMSQLGIAYRKQKNLTKAEDYLKQAEVLLQQNESLIYLSDQANLYHNLGEVYYNKFNFLQAINYYQLALSIFQEIGDRRGESNSLNGLGNIYFLLGEYEKARDYEQQSLNIAREMGDRRGESKSLNYLGMLYSSLKEYEKAIDFYQQSLNIAREMGDRRGESYSLNGLGRVYFSLGEYEKVIDFYQQSLNIAREIGDRLGESNSLNDLGMVYFSLREYEKAIDFCQQSLNIAREIGDRLGEGFL
jgi:tetratricopeptide (TPR) repeat protein